MRRVSNSKAKALKEKPSPKRQVTKAEKDADIKEEADSDDDVPLASSLLASGSKNGKEDSNKDGSESESESFEVASILGSRVRHGKRQFKIRWKGFGPADDTWEDEENVDSPDLIAAFLKGSPDDEKPKTAGKKTPVKKGTKRAAATPKTKTPTKKPKSESESGEWEVSKIVDDVLLKDGTRQFLVRWKGFSNKENTWEPEANLNCPELIKKYLDLQQHVDEASRETRKERKQVSRYLPHLSKRHSHRSSAIKSEGDGSCPDSYQPRGVSSYSRIPIHKIRIPHWKSAHGSAKLNSSKFSEENSSWHSKLSSKCSVM